MQQENQETYSKTETKFVRLSDGRKFSYRELGAAKNGIPVVFLHHLTANLDEWDPAVLDSLAEERRVIAFNNAGVGESEGVTPSSVEEMATDAKLFFDALGLGEMDLIGFSLGGFIAQVLAVRHPEQFRRIVLAGTGPSGGAGISRIGEVLQNGLASGKAQNRHPKHLLFFTQTKKSQTAATAFLQRLANRTGSPDKATSPETTIAQITAIANWGHQKNLNLSEIKKPVLVANGDSDLMIPSINSVELFKQLPDANLSIYPDAGHGAIFQYHERFMKDVTDFFNQSEKIEKAK